MRTVDGLAVHRSGSNVVFLPGAGLVGLDYLNVAGDAVFYDRGGTGWSAEVEWPRGAADVAGELRDLLHAIGAPGPYVLVGHSLGGVYARRFAQLFRTETAALLLIDPGHEDLFDYLPPEAAELNRAMKPDPEALPDLTGDQVRAARRAYARLYATWPDDVREELVAHHLAHWRTGLSESANLESEVYDELRAGGPIPDVPVIVLTAGAGNPQWSDFGPPELVRRALDGITVLHASIAGSVSRGEHRVVTGATHQFLHIEQPTAVTNAISDLVDTLG